MKFGVREICDVTFKAAANNQKVGTKVFKKYQPVFMIDTARTSSMEQATTTVYAQGGRGYTRLIAWEGEKTMTFTVEDALMSPMGLTVLSGAGLIKHNMDNSARVHVTLNKTIGANNKIIVDLADLREETGLETANSFLVCNKIPMYATVVGSSGNPSDFLTIKELAEAYKVTEEDSCELEVDSASDLSGKTVIVDFYLAMTNSVTTVEIGPEDFGGFYYVEAQTLFRDEATGKDLAAELIFPKVKIQSGFTFSMAASGDPSTFTFTMDAFPGYAMCKPDKKTMCDIQIIGNDSTADDENIDCSCNPDEDTPSFVETFNGGVKKVPADAAALTEDMQFNQDKAVISKLIKDQDETITVTIVGGIDELKLVEPKTGWGQAKWVALDYNTGEDTIVGIDYINRGSTVTLDETDVADAEELGLAAGHMVVWVKADLAKTEPATFSLVKGDKRINVVINAVDGE